MPQPSPDVRPSADGAGSPLDAIVIGAGFAGMYMVHRLRELGFTVHGFEAGEGVGGTWYWNRYPGARCDSESMYYSYSFLPELEQEWPLEERYPGQPVILRYLQHVADRLELREHFTFGARVVSRRLRRRREPVDGAHRGRHAGAGQVRDHRGGLPVGRQQAGVPRRRPVHGTSLHTGNWPHEPVDFTGKRVGVIGTGASGIQAIPVIAEQAGHLTVFQRTAQFTIPAANGPLDPEFAALWKQNYQEWRRRGRRSPRRLPLPGERDLGAGGIPGRAHGRLRGRLGAGRLHVRAGTFSDLLISEEANQTAADFVRSKIERDRARPGGGRDAQAPDVPVRDQAAAARHRTTTRPSTGPTSRWSTCAPRRSRRSPRPGSGPPRAHYDLDVIVYATGFDALTGPLFALGIQGRDGRTLADAWAEGPKTYLGLAVPGFPNLFTITGPGSPSVLTNMPVSIEQHVEWIGDCLAYLREHGIETIEAQPDATQAWTEHVQEVASDTLYPKAASWYMGANIPGKPRLFLPYIGGVDVYRDKCDAIAASGYDGFDLTHTHAGASA